MYNNAMRTTITLDDETAKIATQFIGHYACREYTTSLAISYSDFRCSTVMKPLKLAVPFFPFAMLRALTTRTWRSGVASRPLALTLLWSGIQHDLQAPATRRRSGLSPRQAHKSA